jgi:cytochrome d ubiquinol oxidase subunit I
VDVLLLSRLQFALTIMFHYLFPPLTIGLSVVLVHLQWRSLRTREPIYRTAAKFWTRMFGLNFAMGVVTGIVMEFEFGTNWAAYSRFVGDVFGSALAAEGIFAFFLESGFLALLLFGWDRIGPGLHFFATLMVSLGGIFSSVWIVIANSWQQTPAGSHIVIRQINGVSYPRAEITDFWALVFNPSTVNSLVHVWIGAFMLGAAFVMSISAWYLLHGRHPEFARRSFVGGLILGTAASLAQFASGHMQAMTVAEHQPAKLAAMEGLYRSESGAGMHLFGWPDDQAREVHYGVSVPYLLSLLVHGNTTGKVQGFDELEPLYGKPPVALTFWSYRVMIGIGVVFAALTVLTCLAYWRGWLFSTRWVLWAWVLMVVPAFVANQAGWVAAEVGRQPWVVYPQKNIDGQLVGGLRTSEGLSEAVRAEQVLGSIVMFGAIYVLLGVLWLFLLNGKIQHGPDEEESNPVADDHTTPGGLVASATALTRHEGKLTQPDPS